MKADLEDIRNVISDIPKQERRALILRDVLEFKYKEIAQILNIEVSSVGVYIHRARSSFFSKSAPSDESCWRNGKGVRLWLLPKIAS